MGVSYCVICFCFSVTLTYLPGVCSGSGSDSNLSNWHLLYGCHYIQKLWVEVHNQCCFALFSLSKLNNEILLFALWDFKRSGLKGSIFDKGSNVQHEKCNMILEQ